ncbi:DNA polymerase III subunit delta' [Sneathiella aquimaris]|uniref:DNA polymerase III subunit delta' n=1 Tax=Sneathiella aquimaris TaxID=2599305 RepID=UPI00146C026E|nr:DNA polymerase III subunit delta' [Sneathiella aquimaris]
MSEEPTADALEGFPHPRDSGALIGHHAAETEFLASFNGGRFHHAWLISGKMGIGKASFAYRAARFLLSQEGSGSGLFGPPDSLDTPADHPAVALMNAGSHPGLAVLRRQYDPKGKKHFKVIRINDVRSLSNFFGLKSSDGGWRVVIVDTVDDMNVSAANAFLKILEEPPARTIFFLLSHTPAGLLPTIRSRCRMLPLKPLEDQDLKTVLTSLSPDLADHDLDILAVLAEGSPGQALRLQQAGGTQVFLSMLELFNGYPHFSPDKLHGLADAAGKKGGETLYDVLTTVFPWWISRLVRGISTGFDGTVYVQNETDVMNRLASHQSVAFWIDIWEKSNHLINRAESVNLDRKQVVLDLFLSTARK